MLTWELKRTLSGRRLDFKLHLRSLRVVSIGGDHKTPTRARGAISVLSAIGKSPCLPGSESGPLTFAGRLDLQLNVRVYFQHKLLMQLAMRGRARAA
eukprot:4157233-Pyramimonas_sp.AAC.1